MRLKSGIWVSAYVRRLSAAAIPAMVVRRGDSDAGAIYIKVNTLDGSAQVLRPAVTGLDAVSSDRLFSRALAAERAEEAAADAYLLKQAQFDCDMWVIEVEDRQGRHMLDEFIACE